MGMKASGGRIASISLPAVVVIDVGAVFVADPEGAVAGMDDGLVVDGDMAVRVRDGEVREGPAAGAPSRGSRPVVRMPPQR